MHEQETKTCMARSVRVGRDIHHPALAVTDAAESNYPPQDGGKGAWLFLFGACIIEVTAWGMYSAYVLRFCTDLRLTTVGQVSLTVTASLRHTSTPIHHFRVKILSLRVVVCPMASCNCHCLLLCNMSTTFPDTVFQSCGWVV